MKDDHKAGRDGTAKRMLWLFGVNLYISAFTFGGGYVVLPMVRKAFVEKRGCSARRSCWTWRPSPSPHRGPSR